MIVREVFSFPLLFNRNMESDKKAIFRPFGFKPADLQRGLIIMAGNYF